MIRTSVVLSMLVVTIQAEQMRAFAPVTALARWEGLERRQMFGHCPEATHTLCPDQVGCCPNGAACTYSRDNAVCDGSCNGGPICHGGGCCQIGYVCGTTNNLCTPVATAHSQHVIEAPMTTTGSVPVVTPIAAPGEHIPSTASTKATAQSAANPHTTTAASMRATPQQAAHKQPTETKTAGLSISKASTQIAKASSSHRVAATTATATTATAHNGNYVGKSSTSETKATASASGKTTSSGATAVVMSDTNGFLVGMLAGWLLCTTSFFAFR